MTEEQAAQTPSVSHNEKPLQAEGFLAHLQPLNKKYKSLYERKTQFIRKFVNRDRFVRPHRMIAHSFRKRAEKVYQYLPVRSRYQERTILKSPLGKTKGTPWQSLDMVLQPSMFGQVPVQASPGRTPAIPSTRELSPGVIIPRKENDSLFKANKPGAAAAKKPARPVIPPRHRMFSRVEEVPQKKEGETATSPDKPSPPEPSMVQREIEIEKGLPETLPPRHEEEEKEVKVEPQKVVQPPAPIPESEKLEFTKLAADVVKEERIVPLKEAAVEPPVVRASRSNKAVDAHIKEAQVKPAKTGSPVTTPVQPLQTSMPRPVQREPEKEPVKETPRTVEAPRTDQEEPPKESLLPIEPETVKPEGSHGVIRSPLKRPPVTIKPKEIPIVRMKKMSPVQRLPSREKPATPPAEKPLELLHEKQIPTPLVQRQMEVEPVPTKEELTPPMEQQKEELTPPMEQQKEERIPEIQARPEPTPPPARETIKPPVQKPLLRKPVTARRLPQKPENRRKVNGEVKKPEHITPRPPIARPLSLAFRHKTPATPLVMREEISRPETNLIPPVLRVKRGVTPAEPKSEEQNLPVVHIQSLAPQVRPLMKVGRVKGSRLLPRLAGKKPGPAAPGVVQRLKQRYPSTSSMKSAATGSGTVRPPDVPLPVWQVGDKRETAQPTLESSSFSYPQEPLKKEKVNVETMPVLQVRRAMTEPAVVQREPDKAEQSPQQVEQTSEAEQPAAAKPPKADLDEIARQVYPLLMRRIAVEKERSSGWLKR